MRLFTFASLLTTLLTISAICRASNHSHHECVPFTDARQHMGTSQCVKGTVIHAKTAATA
jgi:hypothetical protein